MKSVARLLAAVGFVFLFVVGGAPAWSKSVRSLVPPGLADGPGIWVNMWHYPEGDLDAYCSRLKAHGIRNIFIQTSRSNTTPIVDPTRLGAVVEACHRHNIRVIAWSFAELVDVQADAAKLIAAGRFESANGERLDGVAGNMEKNLSAARVEQYSKTVRQALGDSYPMVAVVYSPLNRAPEVANTPWRVLGQYWDVIAPMAYWGGKYQKADAHTYTVSTVQQVRRLVGKSNIEVHVIGDGMGTSVADVQRFLKGCQDSGATSASLYPNHRPTPDQLVALSRYSDHFPTNARFRLAAFRELTRTGALNEPGDYNPARNIPRGEFYRLVVRHLYAPLAAKSAGEAAGARTAADLTAIEALQVLVNAGLIQDVPDGTSIEATLAGPISSRDAIAAVAAVVDLSSHGPSQHGPTGKVVAANRKAAGWFGQPAMADPVDPAVGRSQPLNYLDAAQMVLEARAGLR